MAVKESKTRRPFDLVVIGGEPAGLAAAACAARQGARVALIRAGALATAVSEPAVPDFVWRRLDLQESGLDAVPAGAKVSLFKDGGELATYAETGRTARALADAGLDGHRLWADFWTALETLQRQEGALLERSVRGAARQAAGALMEVAAAPEGVRTVARLTASARGLIGDYFADPDVRTHIANIALTPFGLGGDEAGSALALSSLSEPAAWRIRVRGAGPSLVKALEARCAEAGVEIVDAKIRGIEAADGKAPTVLLDDGETLRARRLMAASVDAAAEAGVALAPALSPIVRRRGAVADIRLRFSRPPAPPTDHPAAVYYLSDGEGALADARDAALEGRLPERPPISFEFEDGDIVVHAPYCPASLIDDGEEREWTEQDRQAFGRQIVSRLTPYLNGAGRALRRVEVRVREAGAAVAAPGPAAPVAPPPGHDPIGAAARLAMDLVSDG